MKKFSFQKLKEHKDLLENEINSLNFPELKVLVKKVSTSAKALELAQSLTKDGNLTQSKKFLFASIEYIADLADHIALFNGLLKYHKLSLAEINIIKKCYTFLNENCNKLNRDLIELITVTHRNSKELQQYINSNPPGSEINLNAIPNYYKNKLQTIEEFNSYNNKINLYINLNEIVAKKISAPKESIQAVRGNWASMITTQRMELACKLTVASKSFSI